LYSNPVLLRELAPRANDPKYRYAREVIILHGIGTRDSFDEGSDARDGQAIPDDPRGRGVNFRAGRVSSITQSAAIHGRDRHYRRAPMRQEDESGRKVHARCTRVGVTACTKGTHVLSVRCEFRVARQGFNQACRRPGPIRYQALGTHGSGGRILPPPSRRDPLSTVRRPPRGAGPSVGLLFESAGPVLPPLLLP